MEVLGEKYTHLVNFGWVGLGVILHYLWLYVNGYEED